MELERAKAIAAEVIQRLAPYCKKIEVAGSIRRKKSFPRDIDLVLIPSDPWNLRHTIGGMGTVKAIGDKLQRVILYPSGIQVDLYYASSETWATLFLIRTGSTENNIRLCSIAQKRGWHLAADGRGLFDERGKRIAGDTEHSLFEALGLPYKEPWERE